MLKQQIYLYDKIREDLFEDTKVSHTNEQVPSITTMFLLQIQVSIIQLLTQLPSKSKLTTHTNTTTTVQKASPLSLLTLLEHKRMQIVSSVQFVSVQCIHWFLLVLLFILDNVARFLNVDHEMAEITNKSSRQQEDSYHHQHKKIDFGDSEPSSPINKVSSLVSPSSPIHSPTPNFVVRQQQHRKPPPTPQQEPTIRGVRIRSLSNNMIDQKKPMSPQKLRRITAQREIIVQNAVLPIQSPPPKHHHKKKPHSIASSGSSSSTTKETDTMRPKMQKNHVPIHCQQYHQKECKKPYERCCPACALT